MTDSLTFHVNGHDVTVTPALIARYDVPGPRYTSYPTYPEWSSEFGHDDLVEGLAVAERPGPHGVPPLSLYAHIPFCQTMCLYCACNVVISRSADRAKAYVDHLIREIDLWADKLDTDGREMVQMHWGGGTPTFLAPDEMVRLAEAVKRRFRFAVNAEIGVEVDPRVTTNDHLEALAAVGFNRLSMGVQDLDDRVLDHVKRSTRAEDVMRVIEKGRALGFESVNIDLMYGLPHQTVESFAPTVTRAIEELRPDRVALFNFAYVPHMKKHQRALDQDAAPPPPEKLKMLAHTIERFTDSGYRFIGLDHFALEDDPMATAHDDRTLHRNFMGYSTHAGADMIALGNTAISAFGRSYAQNAHDISQYQETIAAGRHPTTKGMHCDDEDLLRRDVISRILCHDTIHTAEVEAYWAEHLAGESFGDHFAEDLARLEQPIADGLVTVEDGGSEGTIISVTPLGRLFIRNVAMCFDTYYHHPKGHRRFSRTV